MTNSQFPMTNDQTNTAQRALSFEVRAFLGHWAMGIGHFPTMNLTLKVWRQKDARSPGRLVEYAARNIIPEMSFLEMLDVVNEELIARGEEPIAFDSDCREGICGTCSLVINGSAHGGQRGTTVCQLHMRHFQDGQTITVEPWRARAFPVLKDLVTDRSALTASSRP